MIALQAGRSTRTASLVDGEYALTADDFHFIAALLRERSGIHLPENKAALVYSRLVKRLRKLGLTDFSQYCALLDAPHGAAEQSELVAALTTNVTSFFREPHHFDHLRERVIEPMIHAILSGARFRIWSSACSTGEEAYSIAMTVLAAAPEAMNYDVRVLATDIDPGVLTIARRGVYPEESTAAIPAGQRRRWLVADSSGGYRIRDEVRRLVAFRQLNLIGDWPMRGAFDAIFCRNVAIYFDAPTQSFIWKRFSDYLIPGGRLYVGHSERVDCAGYLSDGVTTYRRAG